MTEPQDAAAPARTKKEAKADYAAEKARAKAARPWYKKKRFMIPLILLVLIIIVTATTGGDGADVASPGDTSGDGEPDAEDVDVPAEVPDEADAEDVDVPAEVPDEAEFSSLGQPAVDGQFTFTVDGLECGVETIGDDFLQEEAQGQFCILTVTVENTGNEARSLDASSQYLYDDQERRFSSSFTLAFAMESPLFEQINPGNTLEGRIPFDVPDGANIEFAELHDSAFSGGVLVDLR
jgi:hypothetical protein